MRLHVVAISFFVLLCLAELADGGDSARYALLVGCSSYPADPYIPSLKGPNNDVALWRKTLTDANGIAFPIGNVQQLAGWPDQIEQRPTRANIVQGFHNLIAKAAPGAQIFILLSGHGTQQPIPEAQQDPLDPKNPEADGLDEVFLPADAKNGAGGLENAILDNEIGGWLEQMRGKGAAVFIVFDCCHSGTMTRGADRDSGEVARTVDPSLFVSEDKLNQAIRRAREAVKRAEAQGKIVADTAEEIGHKKGAAGSVVAFYAAQPFEKAPDLPLPAGVAHSPENYYGLLSFTLNQALQQRQSRLSYRELSRLVACRYRASRGTREPTPFADGDLDYEVFGVKKWPDRGALVLERADGKLSVNAGQLRGLTPGSILAVRRPAGAAGDPKAILGYVRVQSASATNADVVPVQYENNALVAAKDLPEETRCDVVRRDIGDMRVKLFVDDALKKPVAKLHKEVQDMVDVGVVEPAAEWLLRRVSADEVKALYGIALQGDAHVLLMRGSGQTAKNDNRAEERLRRCGHVLARTVYATYSAANEKQLIDALERDLPKIFKWHNVWRIASETNAFDGGESHGLCFDVAKLKNANDRSGGELLGDGVVRDGQDMEFRLKNDGVEHLWVSILYLDAKLGIHHYWSGAIQQGTSLRPIRTVMSAAGDSIGPEGMVVFAIPQSVQKQEFDFKFLEQQPLGEANEGKRSVTDAPNTPFGRLLAAAAFNQGTRGMERRIPTTPAVVMQSWMLLR